MVRGTPHCLQLGEKLLNPKLSEKITPHHSAENRCNKQQIQLRTLSNRELLRKSSEIQAFSLHFQRLEGKIDKLRAKSLVDFHE
jgi:hypothetical protein